jgi:hypothetical protein
MGRPANMQMILPQKRERTIREETLNGEVDKK